jgi:hypothetical protein
LIVRCASVVLGAYEDVFEEIKRAHPHLTDSQVHDFARQKDPKAWQEHKKLGGLAAAA